MSHAAELMPFLTVKALVAVIMRKGEDSRAILQRSGRVLRRFCRGSLIYKAPEERKSAKKVLRNAMTPRHPRNLCRFPILASIRDVPFSGHSGNQQPD